MRRPNRELNIFNISMLDVICSALGAILILFLVSLQSQGKTQSNSEDWQEKYQKLEEKIAAYNGAMEDRLKVLKEQQKKLEEQKKKISKQQQEMEEQKETIAQIEQEKKRLEEEAQRRGSVIGTCEVTVDQVQIRVHDFGEVDGDRVQLKFNERILAENLEIPAPWDTKIYTVNVQTGANYMVITALDSGTRGENTAQVIINPCYESDIEEDFSWRMEVGQVRSISIVRK